MHEILPPDTPPGPHKHVSSGSNGAQSEAVSWLILLALSWLMGSLGPLLTGGLRELAIDKFARSLGAGIGLLAISAVPALIIRLSFRLARHPLSRRHFLMLFTCCVLVAGALLTAGHLHNWQKTGPTPRGGRWLPSADWIPFQQGELGGIRYIDVHSISTNESIVTYHQRYVSSGGSVTTAIRNQIDCRAKRGRTSAAIVLNPDGSLYSETSYTLDETPFETWEKDSAMRLLSRVLCTEDTPAKRDLIVERLRGLRNER
jgi:hypothetical protein